MKTDAENLSVSILKNEFLSKQEKNSQYSIRAFAKYLGVSHALLSMIFNGKRKLSQDLAFKIVDRINFSEKKRLMFLSSFDAAESISQAQINEVELDSFAVISEWQHYAILSLLETKDFKMNYIWIAKRLGISELLAKTSMERLSRIALVTRNKDGKYVQTGGAIRHNNKKSTATTRKFHSQLIKKALASLFEDPFEIRNHSSVTFAMNPKDIPYAMEKIKKFRISLGTELETMNVKTEVYNLTIQLYPVTKRKI